MTTPALLERARDAIDVLVREAMKFGAVGAVAFLIDVGGFNLLRFGLGDGGPLEHRPLTAKIISASIATVFAWLGNRLWTFRHRRRASAGHELALFVLFNVAGMGFSLACLAFSHYVLDLTSARADNVSANVVGMALGTLFRFWAYRMFVFRAELADDPVLAPHPHHDRDEAEPAGQVTPAAPPR